MAAEQSVGLRLIFAVQSIHSKLILLHTTLTSYNTTAKCMLTCQNDSQSVPNDSETVNSPGTFILLLST